MRRFLATLSLCLVLFAPTALGQSHWFVGGAYGESRIDKDDLVTTIAIPDVPAGDDTDSTWKLLGGYAFNRYFAVEGLTADLGQFASPFQFSPTAAVRTFVETDGYGLGVRGEVPMGERFGLYGRAGVFFWESSVVVFGPGGGPVGNGTASDDGTDFYLGIGGRFRFNRTVSLFLDYDRYRVDFLGPVFGPPASLGNIGSYRNLPSDVDTLTLGLQIDFGHR